MRMKQEANENISTYESGILHISFSIVIKFFTDCMVFYLFM
jgi:hypothetical protein